jgi:hypothetical protein
VCAAYITLDLMRTPSLPWRALLISPLATVPVVVLMGLRSSDAGVGSDFVVGLFFAVTVGLPFAYAGMVVVGVPTYLLLQRLGYVKAWVMCLVGAGVPLVLIAGEANSLMLATVGLSGFVVSLVAFMLATRSRQQHEV